MPKISEKIAFHLPTGASMLQRGAIALPPHFLNAFYVHAYMKGRRKQTWRLKIGSLHIKNL